MAHNGRGCKIGSARRKGKYDYWYKAHFLVVQKRKSRNVLRSSHGKFATVTDLVAHQAEIEAAKPKFHSRRAA